MESFLYFIGGIVFSTFLSIYFSDNFSINIRRAWGFPKGNFKFFAPSREHKDQIIEWNATVFSKKWLRGPYIKITCEWKDFGSSNVNIWEYEGPIIKYGNAHVARLDIVKHPSDVVEHNGSIAKAPRVYSDPAFILFHSSTEHLSIRPCIVAGFDIRDNCYGAAGIFSENLDLTKEQSKIFLKSGYYIDYKGIKSRVFEYLRRKHEI